MLSIALSVGCASLANGEVDSASVEVAVRKYYQAFNSYNLDDIESIFTEEAWREEGADLATWVVSAECLGFNSEFVSIESIRNDGSAVLATVKVMSDLGEGKDYFRLVNVHGGWKIIKVITKKVGQIAPVEQTTPSSSCCPQ